jgi:hypothetical protein
MFKLGPSPVFAPDGAGFGGAGDDKFRIDVPPFRLGLDDGGRTHFTPWLVVRFASGDEGARPLVGGTVFWESPDVWVEGSLGINQPVPGEPSNVFARVSNFGQQDATGVLVKFWWADPSLAITEASAHLIGIGSVAVVPSLGTVTVPCPTPWIPVVENGGHECLLAEAEIPGLDPLSAPMDPVDDRHVGQKNEQLVLAAKGKPFSVKVRAVNVIGLAQTLNFEVHAPRLRQIPPLLAARRVATRATLAPATTALSLAMKVADEPSFFTQASPVFTRRLLSMTVREASGTAERRTAMPLISQSLSLHPWETRMVEITGQVPSGAEPGQTFMFRVTQRVGQMVTGGYTVYVVVADG